MHQPQPALPAEWLSLPASRITLTCLIKMARIRKGYTAAQLSLLLGQPAQFVAHRENMVGGSSFSLATLTRIATLLEMPLIRQFRYPHSSRQRVTACLQQKQDKAGIEHHIYLQDATGVVYRFYTVYEPLGSIHAKPGKA